MKIKKEEIIIILLAGGYGKRLSSTINKQMIKVNGITVLEKSIINFQNYLPNTPIQIVTNKENIKITNEIAEKFNLYYPIIGGKERQLSVFNALKHLKKSSPRYVLVHDSARPIISKEVLNALIQFKKTRENLNKELLKKKKKYTQEVVKILNPILTNYVENNSILIVFDKI